ncbi:RNAse P Rpr2/Rpp21/SNM1 subunit domain-containing protein [Crepidotus variabilis]|uniref:RNAse P Rpr2/Rpp21/SNM1 subunit domain-containing protein n=1 Tax=Crepidotus variabilis TaxID=179855 RepID=A0A9P6E6Y2_9AGAR|nr:RNAse P Rpr2/Rpp21/SNM1 subunit domain-containing protein [Crepidotus variabilis]
MGKKPKDEIPNINAAANRDIMQRLNFLQQASLSLQSVESTTTKSISAIDAHSPKRTHKIHNKNREFSSGDLARSYVQCMRSVGQKTTVKMDPSVKRSLCQGCNTILVPGSTASVRVKKSRCHRHLMVYTCFHCKTTKRIPTSPSAIGAAVKSESDPLDPSLSSGSQITNSRNEQTQARPPPLFARTDAGHAVFCGTQSISLGEHGSGLLFAGTG